ncbi:putative high-affinity nicotinic acid transporter protein [Neofusicoccum parvum UCRNP2]|uniref:Putative high-affinity nicotinic acid transporter protein n=1 Tax=Botryosphaeria parva (strain UCR-NP2) TaxID=1287680 RepID=R1ETJ2_BOTPV|nr:putative high-affinity nicotinic acid transporter protein [Neofusicoccum parvum UCRNP2]
MVILVVISHLDRTNIGNARVFGFEEGIGLHGTQFNNISMLFYVLYIVFEIPWVMAVKRWGANRILAIAFVCWSAITLGTGFIHNYRQAVAMRLLLGLFEGGLFPSLTFVISTIYDRKIIIGYAIVVGTANHGVGYFAMFLCGGGIYSFNTTVMSWVSNNLSPDYKRSVGIPLFASLANISGLIASQIYPSSDGPRYVTGNAISMSTEVVAMLMIVMIWLLLRRREAEKERMRQHGTPTNGMEDDRGLDFKYTL